MVFLRESAFDLYVYVYKVLIDNPLFSHFYLCTTNEKLDNVFKFTVLFDKIHVWTYCIYTYEYQ
jgi:hypothetical protein